MMNRTHTVKRAWTTQDYNEWLGYIALTFVILAIVTVVGLGIRWIYSLFPMWTLLGLGYLVVAMPIAMLIKKRNDRTKGR